MRAVDDTDPRYRYARTRVTDAAGNYLKTRRVRVLAPTRNTSEKRVVRSKYRIKMMKYWESLDPGILASAQRSRIYCRDV